MQQKIMYCKQHISILKFFSHVDNLSLDPENTDIQPLLCCMFMKQQIHLGVKWEERSFWAILDPQVWPRGLHFPSWATRQPDKEAPGTLPCTCGWVSCCRPLHRKRGGLVCSPHTLQYEWTSPHWEEFPRRCARRRSCVRSTEDTRRSCFPWCNCCSRCPCGQCSCRLDRRVCPRHWCLPQSSAGPDRSFLWSEPGASSQSVQVNQGKGAARAWCSSPSCFLLSAAGTYELCQHRNSHGQHLGEELVYC